MTKKAPFKSLISKKFFLHALVYLPSVCSGAAFQHFQQSSTSIGLNHSDMAALSDEPATAFYNPAGMTLLRKSGIQFGFASTMMQTTFNGSNKITDQSEPAIYPAVYDLFGLETYGFGFITGQFSNGDNISLSNSQSKTTPYVGFFHGVYKFVFNGLDFAVGLSVTNPWGLETDWKCCKIWTYTGQTSFHSIAVTPSLAIKYRQFSFGLGVSWQDFRFDNYNYLFGSSADFKLKDNQLTCNVSMIYEMDPRTRFGLTYRPSVSYRLKGRADFGNFGGRASSKMILPQTVTFGGYHQLSSCFEIMATAVYTNWNKFKEIDIYTDIAPFSRGNLSTIFSFGSELIFNPTHFHFPIKFKDTLFVAIGSRYTIDQWQISTGAGYDSNPIKKYREALIPDNEHYSLSFGLGYQFTSRLSLDFGYQFILIPKSQLKAPILSFGFDLNTQNSVGSLPPLSVTDVQDKSEFSGSVESFAQVISAQLRWDF